ncbi:MAG: peptidoglycan-binding protein [Archangium sp.]|nr:peptidoglycan-binding protein [Archangium sp.]
MRQPAAATPTASGVRRLQVDELSRGRGAALRSPAAAAKLGVMHTVQYAPARAPVALSAKGPKLEEGATGDEVRKLQQTLIALGYDPGPVDGKFGRGTGKAVKQYQKDHALTQDGVVGPRTRRSMAGEESGAVSIPASPTNSSSEVLPDELKGLPTEDLKKGDKGEDVQDLKRALARLGFISANDRTLDTDVFDETTREALQKFQRGNHVRTTGRYNEATREAFAALADRAADLLPQLELECLPIKQGEFAWGTLYAPPPESNHHGLDMSPADRRNPPQLYSVVTGKVVSVSDDLSGDKQISVVIERDGIRYRYTHLKSTDLVEGQSIEAGMEVGVMGNTGTGSVHLHIEAYVLEGHPLYESEYSRPTTRRHRERSLDLFPSIQDGLIRGAWPES